jgi:hypothetical protein
MMENNQYILSGSFWSLVSAVFSTAAVGVFALLSLTSVYRAPQIVRVEVLPAESTGKPA